MKLIFILVLFYGRTFAIDVAIVEKELLKASNELITRESSLRNVLSISNSIIRTTANNLNNSLIPKDFVNDLDNFSKVTREFLTIRSLEKSTNCENGTSDCLCIDFRMAINRNNIFKVENLLKYTTGNTSKLNENRDKVFFHFMVNFRGLQFIWTKESLVLKFFRQSVNVFNEFGNYFNTLKAARDFYIQMDDYLSSENVLNNCAGDNSSFSDQGDVVEDKMRSSENNLLNLVRFALDKVNKSRNTASSDLKPSLDNLFDTLKGNSECNDFNTKPTLKWPKIPDTAGAAYATMKVRSCQARKESYDFSSKAALQNQTRLKQNLDALKSAAKITTISKSNSRTKRSVTPDIYEVINSTSDVITFFTSYLNDLNLAITQVDVLSQKSSLTLCNTSVDVIFSTGYYKTICNVDAILDFPTSQDLCRAAGLKLLQVQNNDDFTGLLQAAFTIFKPFVLTPNPSLHIDGTLLSNGTWFVDSQRLFGISPPTNVTGRSLQVTQIGGSFKLFGVNSNFTSSSYCEIVKTSMNVSTSPNTKLCRYLSYIRDPSGKYLKTACIMIGTYTEGDIIVDNPGANAYCIANRMKLYEIRTVDHYNGIREFLGNRIYGNTSWLLYHTAGTRTANGSYVISPDNGTVFSGALSKSFTGPCLMVAAAGTDSKACHSAQRIACEFVEFGIDAPKNLTTSSVCGTFVKYEPSKNRTNPEIFGVAAGVIFQDRWKPTHVQYVGYGNAPNCVANMTISPGYITTSPAYIYAGAYMPCSSGVKLDTASAFYLANHPDLKWIQANVSILSSIPAQIKQDYNSFQLRFGRILVNNFYTLGRLDYATGTLSYTDNGAYKETTTGYEVLTC